MSHQLAQRASDFGLTMHRDAVYAATNGPRFETPAEIRMMRILGASVVGMTGMPEVALAREAGMCFAGVALSINWAAGIQSKIEMTYDRLARITAQSSEALYYCFTQYHRRGLHPSQDDLNA